MAELLLDATHFSQARVLFEPNAIVAEIRTHPRVHLGRALGRLAVGVKPVPPLLGLGIGHPDLFGRAGQIGFANPHGTDLVVVGVRLLELAQMATLQDQGAALDRGQGAHHLETVPGSFQHDQILGAGVLLGPALELAQRHFVKRFLHEGGGRSRSPDQGRREAVRVRVQANHALDKFGFFVHVSS